LKTFFYKPRKTVFLLLMAVTFQLCAFAQQEAITGEGRKVLLWGNGTWTYADSFSPQRIKALPVAKLEIPETAPHDIVITHTGFSLLYNEAHEQASWVAYVLTKEKTAKIYERENKFIPDPAVKTGTACDRDYAGSGYDRGHLAPASDMGWSAVAMSESFYYSNISPQVPSFNRGVWKRLEELVRTWAVENDTVYVVTGPVLTQGLSTIGPNRVSVPRYYYKVVLDYTEPGIKGIGFILPNAPSGEPLQHFAVSIDSVEKVTGINFFPSLPDDQEAWIEKTVCIHDWTWKAAQTGNSGKKNMESKTSVQPAKAVQCKGITKDGKRCKNKTLNPSGYCYLHENQCR